MTAFAVAGCASAGKEDPIGGGADARTFDLPDADPGAPDARPGAPDARPGTPDAAPGAPDAQVVPPDAMVSVPDAGGGCTTQTVQLLLNSDFDSGAVNWVESGAGYPIVLSTSDPTYPIPVTPHSGVYAAWLGGVDSATRHVRQDVAVPAGATNVEVVGMRWIATEETSLVTDWDTYTVTIRNTGGTVLETVASLGNTDAADAWISWGGAVSGSYAGQTIRVQVESTQDSIDNTNFFTDTVVLRATVCQ